MKYVFDVKYTIIEIINMNRVCTFHGLLIPLKNSGIHMGKTTASFKSFLASSKSAISSLHKHLCFSAFYVTANTSSFLCILILLFCCGALYHLTFGFWDIMSLSKVSTRSLSSPALSNLFTSVSETSDLFCGERHRMITCLPVSKLYSLWQNWTDEFVTLDVRTDKG